MSLALLTHDPQPTAVLDTDGSPRMVNLALSQLLGAKALNHARALLPGNLPELERARRAPADQQPGP